jgi:hypothetical protein
MTLYIWIGRRVPKSWFRRQANRAYGLLTFQENIYQMIKQSMSLMKRKIDADGRMKCTKTFEDESEDMYYNLCWMKITIQGPKEMEKEEYDEAQGLYKPLNKTFKKDLGVHDDLKKHFKSKILSGEKVEAAYKEGYGAIGDNNLANKLLEMGILTYIELIDDYEGRSSY